MAIPRASRLTINAEYQREREQLLLRIMQQMFNELKKQSSQRSTQGKS